jgi:hypothetical protein
MSSILFKFETALEEDSLESLFDTVATIIPEDAYTEQTSASDGIESDHNVVYHITHGEHCYEMPLARPLSVEEGKALYGIIDQAIDHNYIMEISANPSELQNRYKISNFQGSILEGDLD